MGIGPVDFFFDGSSIDLDFHKGSLDFSDVLDVVHLGVSKNSDGGGFSGDVGDNFIGVLFPVSGFLIFGKGLVLSFSSVSFVESSNDAFG